MIQRTKPKSNKDGAREPARRLDDLSTHELKMLSWYRVFGIQWSEDNSETYRNEETAWDIIRFYVFEAYVAGEMKLEPLIRQCAKVLNAFELSEDMQQRMLGEITRQALQTDPPLHRRGTDNGEKRARGRPPGSRGPAWLRALGAAMVDEAVCAGLARDRRPGQAFDSVREDLLSMGIAATPRQLEKWDKEHRRLSETSSQDSRLSLKKK